VNTPSDSFVDVSEEFVECLALSSTARNRGNFGPIASFFRLWKKKKAEKEPIARAPAEEKAAEQFLSKRAIQ
jgi:hypothetical protein